MKFQNFSISVSVFTEIQFYLISVIRYNIEIDFFLISVIRYIRNA